MITYDDNMDLVFHALAHKTRRHILDIVRKNSGLNVGDLATHFDVSRIAIMNHLAVLSDAGLIISEKSGRSRHLYLNIVPIQEIHERWTDKYSAYWADRMTFIKNTAEAENAVKKNKSNTTG